MAEPIYHMCRAEEWETAQKTGEYTGSSQDRADGFIHFSTRPQIVENRKKLMDGAFGIGASVVRRGAHLWTGPVAQKHLI